MHHLPTCVATWLGRPLAPRLLVSGRRMTGLDVAPGVDADLLDLAAGRATVICAFARGAKATVRVGAVHEPDIARHPFQASAGVIVTRTLSLLEASVAAGHDRLMSSSRASASPG